MITPITTGELTLAPRTREENDSLAKRVCKLFTSCFCCKRSIHPAPRAIPPLRVERGYTEWRAREDMITAAQEQGINLSYTTSYEGGSYSVSLNNPLERNNNSDPRVGSYPLSLNQEDNVMPFMELSSE